MKTSDKAVLLIIIIAIFLIPIAIIIDFSFVAILYKLFCWAFGYVFSWKKAIVIWIIKIFITSLLNGIIKFGSRKG